MSLYNMLFGRNPCADILLAMLELSPGDCGRFRDCHPNDDGSEIHVFTRNGGRNRDDYEHIFNALSAHPQYLRNFDDDFDCTYATIVFKTPDACKAIAARIADRTDTTPPMERFQKLIEDMESGKDSAPVSRALVVGKQIMEAIQANESKAL